MDGNLLELNKRLKYVDVFYFTGSTYSRESHELMLKMLPLTAYAALALLLFTFVSGFMLDPVRFLKYQCT